MDSIDPANSQGQSSPTDSSQTSQVGGSQEFSTPAGSQSFADSVPVGASDAPYAQQSKPSQSDGRVNAELMAQAVNALCVAKWQAPLTETESADLVRDTQAVLKKYNVPDLPASEEISLAVTLLKIGVPRIMSDGEAEDDDHSVTWQERVGEDSAHSQAGVSPANGADPSLDLIS